MAASSQGQASGKGGTGVSHGSSDKNRTAAQGHQGAQASLRPRPAEAEFKKKLSGKACPSGRLSGFSVHGERFFVFAHGPGWALAHGWLPGSRLGVFVLLFDRGDAGLHPT